MAVKEGVWGEGGLMKYLRFRLNRNSEKLLNKRGRPRAPIVPGTRRKQGPGGYRCEESPYWVGTCRLCSQLCCCAPAPATSPLPLSAFVRVDFTPSWLHSNGFVSATRRPGPLLTIGSRSRSIAGSHIHPDPIRPWVPRSFLLSQHDKVMNPVCASWCELGERVEGLGWREGSSLKGSACLALNSIWLMESPFLETYVILWSQKKRTAFIHFLNNDVTRSQWAVHAQNGQS